MSDADPLIELRQVSKSFGATDRADEILVLKDIDFSLHPGEIVAILGRSGCGKSTLLRIICGLTRASSGVALYRGQPVTAPVAGISMVFQTFGLFPWLTVLENVELGLEALKVPGPERRQRALAAIDMIGLDGFESAYPKELSGGMRQRVGFARALVVNPDVLLMDEAFSALDVPTSETLRGDLLDLWLERQIPTRAILMVSHSIEETLMIADRVVILDSNPGRVKAQLQITLKHPRDDLAPAFRRLVEEVYEIMTAAAGEQRISSIGHRLPAAHVAQLLGLLDEVNHPTYQGRADLSALADALKLAVDRLFPIIEALQLLDFAQVADGEIRLNPHSQAFLDADIQRRKMIFGEHLLRRVPLAAHICRVIDERPGQRAPESRFLRELEDFVSEEEAERVLHVIVDWGRYAELFAFDYQTGIFSAENPGAEGQADNH
ncbi:nitrate/sulfonate/bicarbonate ABC transporter ATP-binding protein [uncultured Thiodictyon sp.]|uniref:ABC transporter ATP-binding protein n=1 Tax=uncultured Thiodictyon sp. TaxID=1846217 RepID=UPI0025DCDA38|nr:nitrate/sulfonate/bicarbonate ABC transporter ATP-binding protein [uncultured Thiodictyon sp.]